MTREEARKAAEVMMAYAEGKEIEFYDKKYVGWYKTALPSFNWDKCNYRIKNEPTYRPFKDKEECWAEMQKHQPFGWLKGKKDGVYSQISCISDGDATSFYDEFNLFVFADGTPFGIKEEKL